MPGAADSLLDEDALGERTVVVGTFGANRKQLLPAPRQQHRLSRDVPQQHAAIGNIR